MTRFTGSYFREIADVPFFLDAEHETQRKMNAFNSAHTASHIAGKADLTPRSVQDVDGDFGAKGHSY